MVVLITDLVEAVPLPPPLYTELLGHLMAALQITDIQREELLFNMPPLAAQKPSEFWRRCFLACVTGARRTTLVSSIIL
jgi:hypothetical protein